MLKKITLLFGLVCASPVFADVITFDDIPVGGIVDGYQGFIWEGYGEFGYEGSLNGYGDPSSTYWIGSGISITRSAGGLFNVDDFVAANGNCLGEVDQSVCPLGGVRYQGLLAGSVVFDAEYWFGNGHGPLQLTANYQGIDEFRVWNNAAELLVLDDLRVSSVPVPAAAWLFGSALMGLVAARRRK